jgi:hypothetical protein
MNKEVQKIFKDNDLHYEWWESPNGNINVNVEWGDWRHDHWFLEYVMRQNGYIQIDSIITEEDETDAYSAKHIFKKKNEDD